MDILTITPFASPDTIREIATVYRKSFGGPPWNEGYLCPSCGQAYPLSMKVRVCPACTKVSRSILLVEHWPISRIISDFYREMTKPDPICVIARSEKRVIGFAWGYAVFSGPDLDMHLDAPGLCESLRGRYFYLDECAVDPDFQGKGVGKTLLRDMLGKRNEDSVILRTKNRSPMFHLTEQAGGSTIRHISDERVIMCISRP
jgi:GNAT superfamily N-acetyltransferase